ncbi:odorant receptor 94b-like [Bradysia coprophila]|uniref:odorant receptor 94b-like n=1 Tax=Bradysia coprophila TaxID=38358 RepID=UPI00187D80C2|nr:odorant receptor 94b-like [Bradysia coprophila]
MHSTKTHKVINLMISFFYHIGFWHRGANPTVNELKAKFFYCIYHALFLLSLVVGAITTENVDKKIFLSEVAIAIVVLLIKLCLLIWKQSQILVLLNRFCVFSIRDDDDASYFNEKLGRFMKFVTGFLITALFVGFSESVVLSFVGSEKSLFLEIAFPLDWKHNDIAFCITTFFIFTEVFLAIIAVLFSILIWYLLLICSLRHDVLGSELRKLGHEQIAEKANKKILEKRMQYSFFEGLKSSIKTHLHLRELTNELESFFSKLFLTQFGTSGLCICGSIYCLAFNVGDNLLERLTYLLLLLYFISELFMITYFGNEIMLSSNRLSYSLFQSNWVDQPHSTKKCIIIFGEYLKQPQELIVGRLYPLTLETFTRILNSAYSMFNILKSFQQ